MNIKAIKETVKMTPWFFKQSWRYVVTKKLSSKIEYFTGIIPAWVRFSIYTYKDFCSITN